MQNVVTFQCFNPRSPWGERLVDFVKFIRHRRFQSTLPVGGATAARVAEFHRQTVSIHAPRGGSDEQTFLAARIRPRFNPRSPWGERPTDAASVAAYGEFQSTLPVGGATTMRTKTDYVIEVSIHAPRGGSDYAEIGADTTKLVSIHAPRGGSDVVRPVGRFAVTMFQSTLPVGGATEAL